MSVNAALEKLLLKTAHLTYLFLTFISRLFHLKYLFH